MEDQTTMLQVQQAINEAKRKYQARAQQSKVRKWIIRLSERVMHYSKIMDTLAQHNPEYTALAWGTMKFILTVGFEHEIHVNAAH